MPTMNELIFASIAEITAGYRDKKFSPLEVMKAHLERLAQLQPKLNAFVHLDAERALEQAEAATAAVMREAFASKRPLHGIPLTIRVALMWRDGRPRQDLCCGRIMWRRPMRRWSRDCAARARSFWGIRTRRNI